MRASTGGSGGSGSGCGGSGCGGSGGSDGDGGRHCLPKDKVNICRR